MADGVGDILAESTIGAEEAGLELLGDAEHVLEDEYLSVGVGTGADADGGDLSSEVTSAASLAGIFSRTRAKHPASWRMRASFFTWSASSCSVARTA